MNVDIVNATKIIKGRTVLNRVDLHLTGGNIYGLQGPNGSGKTMLMRLVAGLIRPTTGEVRINGKQLGKDMDFPASIGLLIENPAFLANHTGLKNLELLAQIQGQITNNDICEALIAVGLDPADKRTFRKYSLGMKQRLGIAAAIMEKPELILLDEPVNALDTAGVEQICNVIKKERERGALILLSCHDATILEGLSDKMFTVSDGKVFPKTNTEME